MLCEDDKNKKPKKKRTTQTKHKNNKSKLQQRTNGQQQILRIRAFNVLMGLESKANNAKGINRPGHWFSIAVIAINMA